MIELKNRLNKLRVKTRTFQTVFEILFKIVNVFQYKVQLLRLAYELAP